MDGHWWCADLGDPMLADAELARVAADFETLFPTPPPQAAVFLRHESRGDLHCSVMLYFSPASGPLAARWAATPSPAPARAGLGQLAGDPAALAILFEQDEGDGMANQAGERWTS